MSAGGRRLGERQGPQLLEQGGIVPVEPAVNSLAVSYFKNITEVKGNALLGWSDSRKVAFMSACRVQADYHKIPTRKDLLSVLAQIGEGPE